MFRAVSTIKIKHLYSHKIIIIKLNSCRKYKQIIILTHKHIFTCTLQKNDVTMFITTFISVIFIIIKMKENFLDLSTHNPILTNNQYQHKFQIIDQGKRYGKVMIHIYTDCKYCYLIIMCILRIHESNYVGLSIDYSICSSCYPIIYNEEKEHDCLISQMFCFNSECDLTKYCRQFGLI